MKRIQKLLFLSVTILLTLPILAGPKKRALEEDYDQEDLTLNNDSVNQSCESFKKIEVTTRNKEENRRDEEYQNLVAQLFALQEKKRSALHRYTRDCYRKNPIASSLCITRSKSKAIERRNQSCARS